MFYGDCRWTEIDALDKNQQVVVCPLAATEQHGHHLPLLTDTYLVTAVAEGVHEQLSDRILLTPTMWLGASDHHLDFPGTISNRNSHYIETIKQTARCFLQAGFRRIFFLNGHGGNLAPGEVAITELANVCDMADGANITLASYWDVAAEAMRAEHHGISSPNLTHACEYETSMMLHLRPELVRMDKARGESNYADHVPAGVRYAGRFGRFSASGALDHPELATAEKGQSLLTAIIDSVSQFVREFADWPIREQLGPRK